VATFRFAASCFCIRINANNLKLFHFLFFAVSAAQRTANGSAAFIFYSQFGFLFLLFLRRERGFRENTVARSDQYRLIML